MTRDLARALVDDEALRALSRNRATLHQVWEVAAVRAVAPYLAWRVSRTEAFGWATATTRRARETRSLAVAAEAMPRAELERVVRALADGGVAALVMGGAAVAYSHYPEPALRPDGVISLLVANGDRGEAERILSAAGYQADLKSARPSSGQCQYRRRDRQMPQPVNLHWSVGAPPGLPEPMTFPDLWKRRVAIAAVPPAMTFIPPDRLLIACLELARHRPDCTPLLALLDVHLLTVAMSVAQWQDFLDRATAAQLHPVCVRSLRQAVEVFGTPLPADVHEWQQQRLPGGTAVGRLQAPIEHRYRTNGGVWDWIARLSL